jgi:O-antigen/teichoic acid export membrane protein
VEAHGAAEVEGLTQAQSATRRVAGNSMLQAGADAIGKVGQIVLYAVMAREVGAAAFGDFTSATSLTVLVLVAAFGMDFRVTRLVAKGEEGAAEAFWGALALKAGLGLVALAGVLGIAVIGPYDHRVIESTALIGVAMLSDLALMTPQAVFRGLERVGPVATGLVVYRGTLAVAGVVLLLAGASVVAVAGAWVGCSLLGLAYTVGALRRTRFSLPRKVTREGLRAVGLDSIGLGLAAVFGAALARVDIVILGFLKNSDSVALYGAAYRLVESMQFITAAIALSSFATLSRLSRTSSPTLGEASGLALKTVLIVTLPVGVLFAVYARPMMEAFYGSDFGRGEATLQILAPTVVLAGLGSIVTFILTAQQQQRPIVIALGLATLTNIVLNLTLIPSYDEQGAAVAIGVTMVVMGALLLRPMLKRSGRIPALRVLASPVCASAAMAAAGLALGQTALSFLAALVAFPVVLLAVEYRLYPDDAARVTHALRRRKSV